MAKSLEDLVREKKKALRAQSGRRERAVKPPMGKSRWRILPSWRGKGDAQFYHDFGQHWLKNSDGEIKLVYVCSERTFGKPCDVCKEIIEVSEHASSDDERKIIDNAKSKAVIIMNAVRMDADDGDRKTQVFELTPTTFEQVLDIIIEWGDITDIENGREIVIDRSGTGLNTKYSVQPAGKTSALPKKYVEQATNLDEYVSQEYAEGVEKAKSILGAVVGKTAALSSGGYSALEDHSDKGGAAPDDDDVIDLTPSKPSEEELAARAAAELDKEEAAPAKRAKATSTAPVEAETASDDEIDALFEGIE